MVAVNIIEVMMAAVMAVEMVVTEPNPKNDGANISLESTCSIH